MLRKVPTPILLGLIVLSAVACAHDAEKIAGKFVALAQVSDAAGLSKLFHYPPDMFEELVDPR